MRHKDVTEKQKASLIRRTLKQIEKRELSVPYGFYDYPKGHDIIDRTINPSMWLFHANYYAKYSSRESWWVSASYLCGHSDGQDWAVRVPGTLTTIEEALEWLTPTQVKKAKEKGKKVIRQGDMYFVPLAIPHDDLGALEGTRHTPYGGGDGFRINHPEHPIVLLERPYRWRAIQQKQLDTGGSRRGAD